MQFCLQFIVLHTQHDFIHSHFKYDEELGKTTEEGLGYKCCQRLTNQTRFKLAFTSALLSGQHTQSTSNVYKTKESSK